MPNHKFKKKDQPETSSTVMRSTQKKYGRRPLHPSYLIQRAMRAPHTLTEEDRFHLRNSLSKDKLKNVMGETPQDTTSTTESREPTQSQVLTPTATPFNQNGPQKSEPTTSPQTGQIQRAWWSRNKNKEEDRNETTTDDELEHIDEPEHIPAPQGLGGSENVEELLEDDSWKKGMRFGVGE